MTIATHAAILKLAQQAAEYITRLNGISETFEIEYDDCLAVIAYTAEIAEDAGDRWTAPSWEIKSETTTVVAVYDNEGDEDPEAARWLGKMLN